MWANQEIYIVSEVLIFREMHLLWGCHLNVHSVHLKAPAFSTCSLSFREWVFYKLKIQPPDTFLLTSFSIFHCQPQLFDGKISCTGSKICLLRIKEPFISIWEIWTEKNTAQTNVMNNSSKNRKLHVLHNEFVKYWTKIYPFFSS